MLRTMYFGSQNFVKKHQIIFLHQITKQASEYLKLKDILKPGYKPNPGENKLRRYKKNYKSEIKIPDNIMEDIRILLK